MVGRVDRAREDPRGDAQGVWNNSVCVCAWACGRVCGTQPKVCVS